MAKKKTVVDVQMHTADMVDNLAASIFRWEGLPYEMAPPSEMLELMLLKHRHLACFQTNLGPMILPCVMSRLNQWGLPAEGSAKPIIVGNPGIVALNDIPPIVVYDQPAHGSILPSLQWYTDAIGKLRHAIDCCTMWLKTPVIFETSEEQEDSVRLLIAKIERGDTALAVYEGGFSLDTVKITPTSVTPAVLQALHESYLRIRGMLFEELGVPDTTDVKLAQQTQTEIIMPMLAVALKTLSRLYMRRQFADRVNSTYGTQITVNALTLGLIEQSLYASTGVAINLADANRNGIPDRLEVKQDGK